MRNTLLATLGSILTIAITLLFVIGVFWVIDLAPILLFLGVIAAYAIMSTRERTLKHDRISLK